MELFKDLAENRFLFWAVVFGAVSVFPVVYIPVLNRNMFKHTAISWDWGVVIATTVLSTSSAWRYGSQQEEKKH